MGKALFEKVKGLLNGVKAEGRRLLDAESDIAPILAMLTTGTNADPAQVEEANKLLDELIAEGEKEALDLAKYEHGVALSIWNAALADLNKKQYTLDSEKARIEGEELDLVRIMELLNQL